MSSDGTGLVMLHSTHLAQPVEMSFTGLVISPLTSYGSYQNQGLNCPPPARLFPAMWLETWQHAVWDGRSWLIVLFEILTFQVLTLRDCLQLRWVSNHLHKQHTPGSLGFPVHTPALAVGLTGNLVCFHFMFNIPTVNLALGPQLAVLTKLSEKRRE